MNLIHSWSSYSQGPEDATSPGGVYPRAEQLDNSKRIANYVTQGLCIGLSSIFVVLRFYAKKTVWKAWDGDDCEYFNRQKLQEELSLIVPSPSDVCHCMGTSLFHIQSVYFQAATNKRQGVSYWLRCWSNYRYIGRIPSLPKDSY